MIPALEVRYGLQKATILSQGTLYTIFLLIVAQTGWYSIGTLRTMSLVPRFDSFVDSYSMDFRGLHTRVVSPIVRKLFSFLGYLILPLKLGNVLPMTPCVFFVGRQFLR